MYLLISQKENMKNKDNDINGKHIENDTLLDRRGGYHLQQNVTELI